MISYFKLLIQFPASPPLGKTFAPLFWQQQAAELNCKTVRITKKKLANLVASYQKLYHVLEL